MATETASVGTAAQPATETQTGLVVVYWLVVGLPLLWGFSQTFMKAMTLFK